MKCLRICFLFQFSFFQNVAKKKKAAKSTPPATPKQYYIYSINACRALIHWHAFPWYHFLHQDYELQGPNLSVLHTWLCHHRHYHHHHCCQRDLQTPPSPHPLLSSGLWAAWSWEFSLRRWSSAQGQQHVNKQTKQNFNCDQVGRKYDKDNTWTAKPNENFNWD